MSCIRPLLCALAASALLSLSATAQWDPSNGDWGKEVGTDLRVMTWNVEDGICSTNSKQDVFAGNWNSLVQIVASLQPDVLILQECGDNSGNGTGGSGDTVSNLATTCEMFMHGGADTFNGGVAITSYVQAFAPGYDLPHIFVSGNTDGFNRDVIMSRYPFGDVNGDGVSVLSDFLALPDLYAPGVNGGIRGFQFAEIDLPDATYAGDMVMGNSHLKAGGSASDHTQRVTAAQNIAYFIDAQFNGLGTATADPNSKVLNPAAPNLPSAQTVVMCGGDWNEDEIKNGATKGPADWIRSAQFTGGSDGTDRDGSDMTYDASADLFNGNTSTQSSSKLDYLCWQDSIATLRRSWVFNTATVPPAATPPELAGYPINPQLASGFAADHRPVIADMILPLTGACADPTTDLGFAKAGTGGLEPHLSACGALGTGDTADFLLEDALPGADAWLILGFSSLFAPFSGGTLVPTPDILIGPFSVNGSGEVLIPAVPGGGGPADAWIQFAVLDGGATFGRAFSNGLLVPFGP
jgi:endonuclease/exonuclease/phosphatase family metal-dependent hydrolase